MATWRAKQNADYFSEYVSGAPSGKVAGVRMGEIIQASDLYNGILQVSPSRWTKKMWFEPVTVSEPPPPPPLPASGEYILHVKDGVTRKFIPA